MMIEIIGTPAMLEQLAEESAELSQAALKVARILRGENPTPVKYPEAMGNLIEEYTDVMQCANEIGLLVDLSQIKDKEQRFQERIQGDELETVTTVQNRELREAVYDITGGPYLKKAEYERIIKAIDAAYGRMIKEATSGGDEDKNLQSIPKQ